MRYKQVYPTTDFSDIDLVMKNAELNFNELKRIDSLQPDGEILYRYFEVPYADGKVTFQVTEILPSGKCVISSCLGINLDEWDKGSYIVSVNDVKEIINLRLKIKNLNLENSK